MVMSVIQNIVKASGVAPGELVLVQFWGEDKDIGLMHSFATAVAALGASPVEWQQSRNTNAVRFAAANEHSFSDHYFEFLSHFDAVLDIFSYQPVVLGTRLNDAQMGFYRKYMASLFKALQGAKRFTQIRVPSEENAAESGVPADEYITRMTSAYDIDYEQLRSEGKQRIARLSQMAEITILTGGQCELSFHLSGREWHLDAGDGDMPCGEVYIAPLEHETNGMVYFTRLHAGDLGVFNEVTLTVEGGIIISANHEGLNERLAELDTADKTICELGFGLNPNVQDLCGYTVLDEKAHGTFHMAIGDNTMFGGINAAPIHMDFVGTATIKE